MLANDEIECLIPTPPALCFLLPLLIRLSQESPGEAPRMVVLSPTRELCMQIEGQVKQITKGWWDWIPVVKLVCIG